VLLFSASLGIAWARSFRASWKGRLYLDATVVHETPEFRRALAAVEKATGPRATLLGIGEGPDWNATHWSRWLYPRRVLWMSPASARRRRRWLVDGLGIRYAIVLAGEPAATGPGRLVAAGGGAELRELEP
jgi:hypothetical protein